MKKIEIGENIRKIRELKGFSQESLGEELNVSQKQISRIEKGSVSPSFDFLNAICLAPNINLKTLLNFDEEIIFNNHNQAGG